MFPSNKKNSFLFSQISTEWFISCGEQLGSYYEDLSVLRDKLSRFAGGHNIVAILASAATLDQLGKHIYNMEKTFESNLSPYIDKDDQYNSNDLKRIRELALSISSNLDAIARQISWGLTAQSHISQVKRNLWPLLRLVEGTLDWLEKGT